MRCIYVEEKLKEMGVEPSSIDAILITHTHNDHIQGLKTFARKYRTKVYISPKMDVEVDSKNIVYLTKEMTIKDISVKVFKTSHDVVSYGYILQDELVYITDTGYINSKYFDMLKNKKIEFTLDYFFDFEFLFFRCFSLSMKSVFEKLKTEVIKTRKKNIIQSTGSQFPKIA